MLKSLAPLLLFASPGAVGLTASAQQPAPPLAPIIRDNATLENAGGDVTYETDFRSVYAKVLDGWLGADSTAILGGNFRTNAPAFI